MHRVILCLFLCSSLTACSVGIVKQEVLTPDTNVSPTPNTDPAGVFSSPTPSLPETKPLATPLPIPTDTSTATQTPKPTPLPAFTPPPEPSATPIREDRHCGELQFDPAYKEECEERVCLTSDKITISSYDSNDILKCTGPGGSELCSAEGEYLQQFSFENDEIYVHLCFKNGIVDNYSTESFRSLFHSGTITTKFPSEERSMQTSLNLDDFNGTYEDGVVSFSFNHMIDYVHYAIESENPDCRTGDILGSCACYYGIGKVFSYQVDLRIQH